MAKWFTDFTEYIDTQSLLEDWVPDWNTTNLSVTLESGPVMRVVQGTDARSIVRWASPGTVSGDVEIVVKFRWLGTPLEQIRAGVLGNSTADPVGEGEAYYASHFGNQLAAYRLLSGSSLLLDYVSSLSSSSMVWYWLRLRKLESGDYFVRWWEDGTSEPDSWNISTEDEEINSGNFFVGTFSAGDGVEYGAIGAATGGESAPTEPPTHTYQIRDDEEGDGNLIFSGVWESEEPLALELDYDDEWDDGTLTLYLRATQDGGVSWTEDEPFNVFIDSVPASVDGDIEYDPDPVTGGS